MNDTTLHPALAELARQTKREMEDVIRRCQNAIENLDEDELLAAIGALAGRDERIRDASIILGAACRWQLSLDLPPATVSNLQPPSAPTGEGPNEACAKPDAQES